VLVIQVPGQPGELLSSILILIVYLFLFVAILACGRMRLSTPSGGFLLISYIAFLVYYLAKLPLPCVDSATPTFVGLVRQPDGRCTID
jgi:hypothetical protein